LDFGVVGFEVDGTVDNESKRLEADKESLIALSSLAGEESIDVKSHAIGAMVEIASRDRQIANIFVECGIFDKLLDCVCEAYQFSRVPDFRFMFEAGSPERDISHNAISGIANICSLSPAAVARVLELRCIEAMILFIEPLAADYRVHCKEMVREALRAVSVVLGGMSVQQVAEALGNSRDALDNTMRMLSPRLESDRKLKANYDQVSTLLSVA